MTSMSSDGRTVGRTNIQKAALAVGAVFLLVGILGFIPGITANYETMAFAGHGSGALLLGIFVNLWRQSRARRQSPPQMTAK